MEDWGEVFRRLESLNQWAERLGTNTREAIEFLDAHRGKMSEDEEDEITMRCEVINTMVEDFVIGKLD